MPPELIVKAAESASSIGLGFILLWLVSKQLFKSQESHMNLYKEKVKALEQHAIDCDRSKDLLHVKCEDLHNKYGELQANVIDKLAEISKNK